MSGAPRSDTYDVAVVGAGLGGLSSAACLAKAGKRVLVVERQPGAGGNALTFRRGPYTFDPAIHVTAHGFNIEFLDFYLAALGIHDRVELLPAHECLAADIGGDRYRLPIGVEALKDYLAEQFPAEADGVRAFVETCAQTTRESQAPPPRVGLKDLEAAMAQLPMLFKYRRSTLQQVLDEHLVDSRAKAVCGAQWPYLGLPPGKISFMAYAGAWMATVEPGPLYVRGSFQSLADGLVGCIEENGGEIVFDTTVTGVSIEGGRATGIELEGLGSVSAPVVISNADARQTFERLVGLDELPAPFKRRFARMRPSISAFLVFSAAKIDPAAHGLAHEHFVYSHEDHDQIYAGVLEGRPGGIWLSVPTMHDPGLAPDGEHVVIVTSLMPYDIGEAWEGAKPRYTEQLLDVAEGVLPGYREAITFVDSATPVTFQKYTLADQGAAYGWENTPDQTVPKRLDYRTPIGGLFLAGHWTHPGTGSVRCLLSGVQTAAAIEGRHDPMELLAALAGAGSR